MSVIIALKDGGRFVLGVDTRMSEDGIYEDDRTKPSKAEILDNGIILLGSGDVTARPLFRYYLEGLTELTEKSLREGAVYKFFNENSELIRCKLDSFTFIVAKDDVAFEVDSYAAVTEIYNFKARGAGGQVAFGSLFSSINEGMSAECRVKQAINAAGSLISSVSKDGFITDTKSKNWSYFE